MNSSESVDEAMAALEPFGDPEMEFVNPDDAIERGTRSGFAGMRIVLENLMGGVGTGATFELAELEERDDRVLIVGSWHARGESSGAEVVGPPIGVIQTIRNGRILQIEWHNDVAEARARFVQAT